MKRLYWILLSSLLVTACSHKTQPVPPNFSGYTQWHKQSQNPPMARWAIVDGFERENEYVTCYWQRRYYQQGKLIKKEHASTHGWAHCPYPNAEQNHQSTQYVAEGEQ